MEISPFFPFVFPLMSKFFLKQTLDSIQKQLFTDYEIIFSDDSTSDEVFKLIHTYEFHGKLKYFRQIPSTEEVLKIGILRSVMPMVNG